MGCSCKDYTAEIVSGTKVIADLRRLFILRMTIDSTTNDRRRKDYNQAIFHVYTDDEIEEWNRYCGDVGLPKRKQGDSYACFCEMDMNMVLKCFDDATKDWRKSWCDTENCNRK